MTELPPELSDAPISESERQRVSSYINPDEPSTEADTIVRQGKFTLVKSAVIAAVVLFSIALGYNQYLLMFSLLFGMFTASLGLVNTSVKKQVKQFKHERSEYEDESLYHSVRDLAAQIGVKMPEIYPLDMPMPNAGAMHAFLSSPTLLISDELVENDEFILRAIVAHELGHIKSKSGRLHFYSAILKVIPIAVPLLIFTQITSIWHSLAILCFTFILAISMKAVECWVRRKEEFYADRVAADEMGNITHASAILSVSPGNPFKKTDTRLVKLFALFSDHPLTSTRVSRLLHAVEEENEHNKIESLDEIGFGGA